MAGDRIEFGRVLDKGGGDKKIWAVVLLGALGLVALLGWAMMQGSRTGDLERQASAAREQAAELEKTLEARDALLVAARAEESLMRSPGAALGVFYASDPRAEESGVAFAHPGENAVRVYLYGLGAPPEGQEYAVAARTAEGEAKKLGNVLPDERGNGFLLAKEVPEGTVAIEILYAPQGQDGLEGATPRIAARYPAEDERGILVEPPAQARRGGR